MAMRTGGAWGAVWAVLLCALLAPAARGLEVPQLIVDGGSGRRGETVEVAIRLAGDADGLAVTADLDLDFPTDLIAFTPPVVNSCTIAPRLAATHQIGGQLLAAGQLSLAIFARGLEINPLGDGDLATCAFRILPEADRSPAPFAIAFASLNDGAGLALPVDATAGAICITVADCDGNGVVAVNEVVRAVNIALGIQGVEVCAAADADGDGTVTIAELIAAVKDVIEGC